MGRSANYEIEKTAQLLYFPTINTRATGERIRELRKGNKLSVKEIQKFLGLATNQSVYKWESGASMPTLDNIVVLAKVLDTTIDNIIVIENVPRAG